jgi:organic hydroperoxide reductase OsmC/OhrA
MVDNVFLFKEIVISVKVLAPGPEDAEKAKRAFDEIAGLCLITKSVNCPVRVEPEITVG